MVTRNALTWIRLLLVVAIAASAMLAVDYASALPTFCGAESGCEQVRASTFSHIAGVPLPVIGVTGLSALLVMSLLAGVNLRAVFVISLLGGGVVAVALLAIQALVIGEFCWLCVIVDVSVILAALLAWSFRRTSEPGLLASWAWIALGALAIATPLFWTRTQPTPRPPQAILDFYQSDKINAVLFADFKCPHCKALHPRLLAAFDSIPAEKRNLHSFFHVQHEDATEVDLSGAYVCATKQNKGRAMAELMFEQQGRFGDTRSLADKLGLDIASFEGCLGNDATKKVLKRNDKLLHDAGVLGFPTLYVGENKLVGNVSDDRLNEAIAAATVNEPAPEPLDPKRLLATALVVAVVIVVLGRGR